jgi:hypothetical protein
VRAVGGLSLALTASLPVLVLASIWSGDWRYVATGGVLAVVGIVVGCTWLVLRERAIKRRQADPLVGGPGDFGIDRPGPSGLF